MGFPCSPCYDDPDVPRSWELRGRGSLTHRRSHPDLEAQGTLPGRGGLIVGSVGIVWALRPMRGAAVSRGLGCVFCGFVTMPSP